MTQSTHRCRAFDLSISDVCSKVDKQDAVLTDTIMYGKSETYVL